MKLVILIFIFVQSLTVFATDLSQSLITDSVEVGCGLSDATYNDLVSRLTEKAVTTFPLKSKGVETGRRLYFFSDNSWFLTLEFFNEQNVDQDVSCIVAHGSGEQSQAALDYILNDYPAWKWGDKPANWP